MASRAERDADTDAGNIRLKAKGLVAVSGKQPFIPAPEHRNAAARSAPGDSKRKGAIPASQPLRKTVKLRAAAFDKTNEMEQEEKT